MKNPKFDKLLAIFCWLGVILVAFLEGYLVRTMRSFPEVSRLFARNVLIVGVLLLLWLAAAVYFTLQARRGKQDKKQAKKK